MCKRALKISSAVKIGRRPTVKNGGVLSMFPEHPTAPALHYVSGGREKRKETFERCCCRLGAPGGDPGTDREVDGEGAVRETAAEGDGAGRKGEGKKRALFFPSPVLSVYLTTGNIEQATKRHQKAFNIITYYYYHYYSDVQAFSSACTTAFTFRLFKSLYVCPVPTNTMGCPVVYVMEIAAPTCEVIRLAVRDCWSLPEVSPVSCGQGRKVGPDRR